MEDKKIDWPYRPAYLSQVVPENVVSLLLAGIVERIKAPILLWEKKTYWDSITPVSEQVHYPLFCRFLTDKNDEKNIDRKRSLSPELLLKLDRIQTRCQHDSQKRAQEIMLGRDVLTDRGKWPLCHLGLINIGVPVKLAGRNVAVCASGKFISRGGRPVIIEHLKKYGLTDNDMAQINKYIKVPVIRSEAELSDFRVRLIKEVSTIEDAGTNYLAKLKEEKEFKLTTDLGSMFNLISSEKGDLLKKTIEPILNKVKQYFNVSFAAIFCSFQKGGTVLPLYAHSGFDKDVIDAHFNWRKAGLSDNEDFDSYHWLEENAKENYATKFLKGGIRGADSERLLKGTFLLPYLYGNHFRGVILFGEFPYKTTVVFGEKNFLSDVGHLLITRILALVAIQALNENELWRNLMSKLWAHMIRAELNILMGEISEIEEKMEKLSSNDERIRAELALNRIKLTLDEMTVTARLTIQSPEAVIKSISSKLDSTEVVKKMYPLSALIENSIDKNNNNAEGEGLSLSADESIERLPSADVDIRLMETVFQNIIDNAIKYSKKGRTIRFYASVDQLGQWATISVENYGSAINKEERERIFDLGYRSKFSKNKEGAGLGLFQAKRFVELHGGRIVVESKPAFKYAGPNEYITTIKVIIPTILYTLGRSEK